MDHVPTNIIKQLAVFSTELVPVFYYYKQRDVPVDQLYSQLGLLNIFQKIKYELAIMTYKSINKMTSINISYPPFTHQVTNYPLRDYNDFRLPLNNNSYIRRSISYRSSVI